MSYFLFLLVNSVLFLRPAEVFPELRGISFYEYFIVSCCIFAASDVLRTLFGSSRDPQPITLCVFGVLAGVVLSHLSSMNISEASRTGIYFLKVVVYYVLLVSILNTPQRLRGFVRWLVVFCLMLTVMTVLQYYGLVELQALKPVKDSDRDRVTGELTDYMRLQGTGIFHDPNEFCLMMAIAVPLALFQLTKPGGGVERLLWLGPLGLFTFAIALTHSRGGLLAFLAGLGVVSWCRYGWRKTAMIGLLGAPVLLVAFAGRQTQFSATEGTGQSRVQVWSDWLVDFRYAPLFGKGMDLEKSDDTKETVYSEEHKRAAHNSYLHAFAEIGIFGGVFFLGAVFLAFVSLYRRQWSQSRILDREQERLLPFLFGSLTALAVGMMSLSLTYMIPTYMILGLVASYVRVTPVYPPLPTVRLDDKRLGQVIIISVAFLAAMYVFVKVFLR